MSASPSTWDRFATLTRAMFPEEWRIHSTLFSGGRFAGFPISLFFLAFVAALSLGYVGFDGEMLQLTLVALAFVLGLQTGTMGFEGSDALENLVGDITLLIYSSKTLPVSKRTTLVAFLLKDLVYYSVLFIFPLTVGAMIGFEVAGAVWHEYNLLTGLVPRLGELAAVSGTAFIAYLIGLLISLGVSQQFANALRAGFLVTVITAIIAVAEGGLTGLQTALAENSLLGAGLLALGALVFLVLVLVRGDPTPTKQERRTNGEYLWLVGRLGSSRRSALTAKTVTEVQRSSGGIWKLLISSAALLAAGYIGLEIVRYFVWNVSPGVVFGALLSMTAFPTYSWLTQIDAPGDYRFYPVPTEDLFEAKAGAFLLLELPVAFVYYLLLGVALRPSLLDAVVGGIVFLGFVTYVFGVTVNLTGFSPGEYMFDTVVYVKYAALVMGALLPILMLALFLPMTVTLGAVLVGYVTVLSGVGYWLFRRGQARWSNEIQPTAR